MFYYVTMKYVDTCTESMLYFKFYVVKYTRKLSVAGKHCYSLLREKFVLFNCMSFVESSDVLYCNTI